MPSGYMYVIDLHDRRHCCLHFSYSYYHEKSRKKHGKSLSSKYNTWSITKQAHI